MALDIQIIQTSIARLCKVIPLEKLSETMYIVQVDHATIPLGKGKNSSYK